MRKMVICLAAFAVLAAGIRAGDDVPAWKQKVIKAIDDDKATSAKMKTFVKDKLLAIATNAVFMKEIAAQNEKKTPVEELKKIEKEWAAAENELPIQKEKRSNATAEELRKISKEMPAMLESFVMDNQGAIVGESNLTSGYWKGDHDKWRVPFAGGFYAGKTGFDKSANATLQQVGFPIVNEKGEIIGSIIVGVDVDKL